VELVLRVCPVGAVVNTIYLGRALEVKIIAWPRQQVKLLPLFPLYACEELVEDMVVAFVLTRTDHP